MKEQVRIVLIGDDGSGKTSLIATLLADAFQEVVEEVVPELTIPPSVTNDRVATHIVDTSSQFPHKMNQQLRTADVVCLCYAVDSENVVERITHWLRHIRRTREECHAPQIPVILVGNKIDVRGDDLTNPRLEQEMEPIMDEFKEVQTCIECSAKSFLNVHEVFYFAQRAVLYPTAILYDAGSRSLREECVSALKRIFKLCDKDSAFSERDGILSDDELNAFQAQCFGASLDPAELQGVKDVVKGSVDNGLTDKGITLTGFLYLHHLFIQKGRLETTWTVLRQFGYDDDLSLDPNFLCPSVPPPDPNQVYCLTSETLTLTIDQAGIAFFSALYRAFNKGETLTVDDFKELFSTAPGLPALWTSGEIDVQTATQYDSTSISLNGWLALWSYTTMQDYKITLQYLGWLGFGSDSRSAITLRPRKEAPTQLCLVVGDAALTTPFLNGFLGGKDSTFGSHSSTKTYPSARLVALGSVPDVSGTEKYLVMRRYGLDEMGVITSRLDEASLVIVLYDGSDSRSLDNTTHVGMELKRSCRTRDAPVLHLALHHTDGGELPDLAVSGIHLEPFRSYSTLFIKAQQLARREQEWWFTTKTWPQAALLGAVAVLVGSFFLYRHFKGNKQT